MSIYSNSIFFIILSIFISIISSYTALLIVERIIENRQSKLRWVITGSFILGTGIFSMHFVGMMSMDQFFTFSYNPLLLLLSLISAVCTGLFAFLTLLRRENTIWNIIISGFLVATGIIMMHYIGLYSIDGFEVHFQSKYLYISIFICFLFSFLAIFVFVNIKKNGRDRLCRL
ncbi:MHYT domain-containing protein [Metabacillus malikii]|uniref:NO-binding membrane sensor protein with MHYT domain n=1 Tax=Metabacillus malikii TaxID=1504265 RepID=A0ABT9ZA70_9BACI|nr:MHYT domain-containing protein [Metabacillus malikii]MDQ0228930.1 NO-binding membrane sensor protein with MHYT domain [Metabacillus malikii]